MNPVTVLLVLLHCSPGFEPLAQRSEILVAFALFFFFIFLSPHRMRSGLT